MTGSAFLGGAGAAVLLFVLARVGGRITSIRLLLAGVTIGYVLAATTSFLIFASDAPDAARAVLFWLLGSLASAQWTSIGTAIAVVVLALSTLVLWGRSFDALTVGDDTARTLGVAPDRFRVQRSAWSPCASVRSSPSPAGSGSSGWSCRTPPGSASAPRTGASSR